MAIFLRLEIAAGHFQFFSRLGFQASMLVSHASRSLPQFLPYSFFFVVCRRHQFGVTGRGSPRFLVPSPRSLPICIPCLWELTPIWSDLFRFAPIVPFCFQNKSEKITKKIRKKKNPVCRPLCKSPSLVLSVCLILCRFAWQIVCTLFVAHCG